MPMIELECPECHAVLELDAGFAGGVCRCANCGALIDVPDGSAGEAKAEKLKHKAAAGSVTRQTDPEDAFDELFTIGSFLDQLYPSGTVYEVRALDVQDPKAKHDKYTVSGYFDSVDKACQAIGQLESQSRASAICVTLNPVRQDLLKRSPNKLTERATAVTRDEDIKQRRWLPVLIEPKRPAGVMSSEQEREDCIEYAEGLVEDLGDDGWPEPIVCHTGNGVALYYRVELPRDDGGLLGGVLQQIHKRYGNDKVVIDTEAGGAAQLAEVVGTTLRRGRNLVNVEGGEDRPHRPSELHISPLNVDLLSLATLQEFAGGERNKSSRTAKAGGDASSARSGASATASSEASKGAADGSTAPGASAPPGQGGVSTSAPITIAAGGTLAADTEAVEITTLSRKLALTLDRLTETHRDAVLGMPTGAFPTLDKQTLGMRGFTLLTGETGCGKTALGMQLGLSVVKSNLDACFVMLSMEMDPEDIRRRFLAAGSGVGWRDLAVGVRGRKIAEAEDGLRLTDEQRPGFVTGLDGLRKLGERIAVIDCAGQPTLDRAFIRHVVEDFKHRVHSHRAFVLVDSLDSVPAPTNTSSEVDRVRQVIGQLVGYQHGSDGDAVMATAHSGILEGEPGRLSRSVCDCVMSLTPGDGDGNGGNSRSATLSILKGREGFTPGDIPLRTAPSTFMFKEDKGA